MNSDRTADILCWLIKMALGTIVVTVLVAILTGCCAVRPHGYGKSYYGSTLPYRGSRWR